MLGQRLPLEGWLPESAATSVWLPTPLGSEQTGLSKTGSTSKTWVSSLGFKLKTIPSHAPSSRMPGCPFNYPFETRVAFLLISARTPPQKKRRNLTTPLQHTPTPKGRDPHPPPTKPAPPPSPPHPCLPPPPAQVARAILRRPDFTALNAESSDPLESGTALVMAPEQRIDRSRWRAHVVFGGPPRWVCNGQARMHTGKYLRIETCVLGCTLCLVYVLVLLICVLEPTSGHI